MKLDWRPERLTRKLEAPFRDAMQLLGRKMVEAATDPIWSWPSAPSPRDVVDTGRLRNSQQLEFTGPLAARFSWPVEYAAAVFVGATLKNGRTLPPRNYPEAAVNEFDLARAMRLLSGGSP